MLRLLAGVAALFGLVLLQLVQTPAQAQPQASTELSGAERTRLSQLAEQALKAKKLWRGKVYLTRMEAFAAEVRRLAPRYYVQTPYFWFPYEPHYASFFFHWRSEQARAKALLRRRHGFSPKCGDMGQAMREVQEARLLDKAQFQYLFPDARHIDEKVAGLTKSLIAVGLSGH